MALKIRLRQQGRTNKKFYRLVVTDGQVRRDGKYIEMLGWWNPQGVTEEEKLSVDGERIRHWLGQGAQLTYKAKALVAKVAPSVVTEQTEREVAKRAKAQAKRKAARKQKAV